MTIFRDFYSYNHFFFFANAFNGSKSNGLNKLIGLSVRRTNVRLMGGGKKKRQNKVCNFVCEEYCRVQSEISFFFFF